MFKKLLNTDLLGKQRPKKRKKKFSSAKKLIRVALYLAATVFIFSVIYLRLEPLIVDHFAQSQAQETLWKVDIKPNDRSLLSDDHRKIIDKKVNMYLQNGTRDELQRLADSILASTIFDQVSVKRVQKDQLEIGVNIPEAVALISVDKLRYLSKNGAVFGELKLNSEYELVKIEGIFDSYRGAFQFDKTNKLITPQKYQEFISQSLKVLDLSLADSIPLTILHYNQYRGISLILKNNITVSLGHNSYNEKIKRLNEILKKATSNGDRLTKIELDFRGKAFIKKQPTQEIYSGG